MRAGFSLLEVLVVLALIGLLSGLVLVGAGASGRARAEREAVQQIERTLMTSRVGAMRDRVSRGVTVRFGLEEIEVAGQGDPVRVARGELAPVDERGLAIDELTVLFEPDGRTDTRLWRIASAGTDLQRAFDLGLLDASPVSADELLRGDSGAGPSSAPAAIEGRLWLIRFDPISGDPVVEAIGVR